ncbi:hypothetical protein JTB14_026508 [Gonioctena quinquepunctata]|nr:hypothetical protein JTB14_026508 [Gonioctena quinquepunctata]
MTDNTPTTVNAETQTIIRVYPHVFNQSDEVASISSDKKIQSVIQMNPNDETSKFFSLLRFTPYADIMENSIRVIDLERKKKLQFAVLQKPNLEADARRCFLADDDGVGEICLSVIQRGLKREGRSSFTDSTAQTDVKVKPHILQELKVATLKRGERVSGKPSARETVSSLFYTIVFANKN